MAQKEYDYLVTLKTNIAAMVNAVSLLLLVIAFGIFLYIGFRILPVSARDGWIAFVAAGFIFLWIMIRFVAEKKPYFRLALLVAGVYFLFSPVGYSWVGFLYIIAGLLEKQAKMPQELGFDKDGITTNSLVPKHYAWNELQNVLIKSNLLTVDFKNNKLFQKEILNPVPKEMETEFNAFCSQYLNQA